MPVCLMQWPIEVPCRVLDFVHDREIVLLLEMRAVWMPMVVELSSLNSEKSVTSVAVLHDDDGDAGCYCRPVNGHKCQRRPHWDW